MAEDKPIPLHKNELQFSETSQTPRLQSSLEIASKSVTFLAIFLSVAGFLVTSIYDSKFGFIQMTPFRPRTLAAGAWFLLSIAIPIFAVASYTGWKRPSWWDLGSALFPYWLGCTGLTLLLLKYFVASTAAEPTKPTQFHWSDIHWTRLSLQILAFLALYALSVSKRVARTISISATVALIGTLVYLTSRSMYLNNFEPMLALQLWFFGVGVATAFELKMRKWSMRDTQWAGTLAIVLVAIGIFGRYYYPHLDSAMGGGSPVPITIYFSKDSPILPNQARPAFLIDESDAGYYVLGKEDTKAAFIPRTDVSLIFFSDDLSAFSLPREK